MKTNIFSKILSVFLLASILFPSVIPYSAKAQMIPSQFVPLESLIQIPKVDTGSSIIPDISRVDWEQKVNIHGKALALNSDEALSTLAISSDIKELIKAYRSDKASIDRTIFMWPSTKIERKAEMNEGLRFSIAKKLVDIRQLPKDYLDLDAQGRIEPANEILNVNSMQTLDASKAIAFEEQPEELKVKVLDMETVDPAEKVEETIFQKVKNAIKNTFSEIVSWVSPSSAFADAASVSEDAINYLLGEQNADGSWGSGSTQFVTTSAVLDALQSQNVTGTEVDNGIAWISSYVTENNDYLAKQIKILEVAAEDTGSTVEALVRGLDEDTGGFIFNSSYKADPITTTQAIQALSTAEYEDPGPSINKTQSLALHYLINTKRFDDGWSISNFGTSPFATTAEVVEALLLWRHRTMGPIAIDDTLNPAVAALTTAQLSDGTWENNTLNTALAYHAIKASGEVPTYQLDTVEYFEDEQAGNGSFDSDLYTTAKVVKALSVSTDSGQLAITDLVPLTTLTTGGTTNIRIVLVNNGNTAIDSGKLHIITDDYGYATVDLAANSIVVNANSTLNVTLGISGSRSFLGAVSFKVFAEGENEVIHPDSRYAEILTFAADPASRPALPMYYVAYKSVSSGGTPAITWRWPAKSDPNLNKYVIMLRVLGTSTWSAANVSYPGTNVTVGSLVEGTTYEATLGTSSSGGSIYFFSTPAQVKVSSNANNYIAGTTSGTVKAVDGAVKGVDVLGVTTGTNTVSDADDGTYTQSNVPWGSSYARVSNFRYETYTNKYINYNTAVTGVNIYTNLKPDTANPTVTSVSIVGESDKVMENKERELIQYTVGDDIGTSPGIVQSTSFYYYEPADSTWYLIGTEEGLLSGTRTYAWDIPGTLLGTGYKIKVIARDFAGKDSTATEWGGTFELTAGNASPTFTFTAPTAAVSANADASYTIKWIDEDPEENASIALYYDPDTNPSNSNHTSITTVNEDDPTDEYVWDTSGISLSSKYIRADITDSVNGTVTVYSVTPVVISH
ncbi:MAG TPA: hypothetical protein VGO63_00945 [Candidatus Paceibacterota bacterium]|nr:hypothetical protein [Candidatus Paceibacterota bacterium]